MAKTNYKFIESLMDELDIDVSTNTKKNFKFQLYLSKSQIHTPIEELD